MAAEPVPIKSRGADWGEAVSLEYFFSLVGRVWRRVLLAALAASAVGALVGILRPKSYIAHASFIAEQTKLPSLPSGLGALAAQFGIDMSGDAGRSPQFYRELLGTSGLLRS